MPDERTHDIYHVDEPEDFNALQEVTAELEQAEADNIMLIGRIEELEANLADAIRSGKDWFEQQKKAHARAVSAEARIEELEVGRD